MNYYSKYIKYKNKYNYIKNIIGGLPPENISDQDKPGYLKPFSNIAQPQTVGYSVPPPKTMKLKIDEEELTKKLNEYFNLMIEHKKYLFNLIASGSIGVLYSFYYNGQPFCIKYEIISNIHIHEKIIKEQRKLKCTSDYIKIYFSYIKELESEKIKFTVMEFLNTNDYKTLEYYIKNSNNIEYLNKRWTIITKLMNALFRIHNFSSIQHRDLHPNNIMINIHTLDIKLIDLDSFCIDNDDCADNIKERWRLLKDYSLPELTLDLTIDTLTSKDIAIISDWFAFGLICIDILCNGLNIDTKSNILLNNNIYIISELGKKFIYNKCYEQSLLLIIFYDIVLSKCFHKDIKSRIINEETLSDWNYIIEKYDFTMKHILQPENSVIANDDLLSLFTPEEQQKLLENNYNLSMIKTIPDNILEKATKMVALYKTLSIEQQKNYRRKKNIALAMCIVNTMTTKPFSLPLNITGARELYKLSKDSKNIILFSNIHTLKEPCEEKDSIEIQLYLESIFKNSNRFIDFYCEYPEKYILITDNYLKRVWDKFAEKCSNSDIRCYENVRLHYVDIRIYFRNVMLTFIGSKNIHTLIIKLYEKQDIKSFKQLIYKIIVLYKKLFKEIGILFMNGEYYNLIEDIINYSFKRLMHEFTQTDYKYMIDQTNYENTEYFKIILIYLETIIMDLYFFARLFKKFNTLKYPYDPLNAQNIIIFAGQVHIELYVHILKEIGFIENIKIISKMENCIKITEEIL
jgi:serine/threonine protein kinase